MMTMQRSCSRLEEGGFIGPVTADDHIPPTLAPGELVDCAACDGTGRMDGTYYSKGKLCPGCNGAGKQRV